MNLSPIIQSQYLAALEMLRRTIQKCPDTLWNDEADKNRFWLLSYHVLFYTHLYLQPTIQDFKLWEKGRENVELMGRRPWPPHEEVEIGEPYTQEEILEYLAFCEAQVKTHTPGLDPDAPSGFEWIPLTKLELQFYNLRHLMLHTGELSERLWAKCGIEGSWVGEAHA